MPLEQEAMRPFSITHRAPKPAFGSIKRYKQVAFCSGNRRTGALHAGCQGCMHDRLGDGG